ncbi:hypothetical protein HCU64_00035 [Methylobacterium sp. C25]|uniref:hypothetical protein n=1 Tax=Methylobacterium sp. C25 TaxID=2721622 RepID=UPI001F2CEF95|nr:hypothetical protein [Methylobacterium sp. C25]MCE4222127.1 hypothetical protein [Methylobacterium sp. C25]
MLDLAIALVWTPLGIAALVAVAAAALALAYLPRAALPLACVAVLLAGAAYVASLQADLAASRIEAREAKADAAAKGKAIEALERNARATAARNAASRTRRDRILSAPASDDGPVAKILDDTLESLR